jgi:SAM-dependent methyltransferase
MAQYTDWNDKITYLKQTRPLYYNDDYIEFLIQRVWKITEPVNIVDFGCGYGFLGLKLLPILPEGSTYTGIDTGKDLIAEARSLFANTPYMTTFKLMDVHQFKPAERYDIAICHALLLHMPDPKKIIERMKNSVANNGMVICFEPFWLSSMAHISLYECTQSDIVKMGILQKLYELDAQRSGKDGNIGMKLPVYMSEMGLIDVNCRVSDRVNYVNPKADSGANALLYEALCEEGLANVPDNEQTYVHNLMERGLTEDEARTLFHAERRMGTQFREHGLAYNTLMAPTMMITYGTVAG